MRGNGVATLAQPGEDLDLSPMLLLLHGLGTNVVGVGVIQDQTGNLTQVQVRKRPYVVPAKGISHQNIGSRDVGTMQCGVKLPGNAHAGARQGARIAKAGPGTVKTTGARPRGDSRLHR
jgi:hypothetical protein